MLTYITTLVCFIFILSTGEYSTNNIIFYISLTTLYPRGWKNFCFKLLNLVCLFFVNKEKRWYRITIKYTGNCVFNTCLVKYKMILFFKLKIRRVSFSFGLFRLYCIRGKSNPIPRPIILNIFHTWKGVFFCFLGTLMKNTNKYYKDKSKYT